MTRGAALQYRERLLDEQRALQRRLSALRREILALERRLELTCHSNSRPQPAARENAA